MRSSRLKSLGSGSGFVPGRCSRSGGRWRWYEQWEDGKVVDGNDGTSLSLA